MITRNTAKNDEKPLIFKSIRVVTNFHENGPGKFETKTRPLLANLNYLRTWYDGYDYLEGDEFDAKILEFAKAYYFNAYLIINTPVLTAEQLKTLKSATRGNFERKISILLNPSIEISAILNQVAKTLDEIKISLDLQIHETWCKDEKPRFDYEEDCFILLLSISSIENLPDTIIKP